MSSLSSNPTVWTLQLPDLLDAALIEYSRNTGKDIATDPLTARFFDCKSSDAVLDILEEQAQAFDKFRKGDRKVQLMRRLKPTVDILLRFSTNDVVLEGTSLVFPSAKAIFAGVGLLLAAAKGVSDSYDALIELFECLEHFLGRLKVLTVITHTMGEILVKILAELLNVLSLATQQIKQGRFKKFANKIRGENEIEAVLQRLDRLTEEERNKTATQTMEVVYGLFKNMEVVMADGKASIDNIRGALVKMQTISDELNKIKRDQLREKIKKWLSPPDPSINHNTACEAHQDGTAMWFLDGSIYNEWKAKGSFLWTYGNPGSGKSILCSSIIKDIESIRTTGLASVAYYYFDFKDTGKQDRRGLLSSLLIQLCTRSHQAYSILSSLYEAHENGLRQPSEVYLIQCLKDLLKLPRHGKVYIIVDALDECPTKPRMPSPREKVLSLMEELVGLHHPDVRVCITSRPEVDIRRIFEPLASHAVSLHDERGQRSDIINYIKSVVQSDTNIQRRWRAKDRQLVINLLSENANGMFRWVVCQLDRLRRCFPESILRVLNELPRTLDETYDRILLEIDEEMQEYAIRLFQCLAFSRRPLRVKELAEVFAVKLDDEGIPSLDPELRPGDADEAVLSACSTLVTIIKPDDPSNDAVRIVQFSHYSVKEFLTSERLFESDKRVLSQYYISLEPAHTVLAQTCISTLLQENIHIGDIADNFPLAKYAAQNWFHHAQYDGVITQIENGMKRLFDPDRKHFEAWVSIYNIDHFPSRSRPSDPSNPPGPSPLYYATLCGFGSLVEYLITRQQDPKKSHGGWGTALHAAVVLGHIAIAQILLEKTADVNARDKHNSTPLHEASGSGNLDVIKLLLKLGAHVNVFDHQGDSPLRKASRSQKFDVMELLVNGGADVNARDKSNLNYSTALHDASGSGNLDVAQLLLRLGADVNTLDHRGDSPLHKAFQTRNFDAMKLLVKGGADVNVRDKFNSTLLHEASGSGNPDVIELLLSLSADVNALDHRGDSPLHKASRYQKIDAMKLLVNRGADVNARDKSDSTALLEASGSGNLDVIELLLSLGADASIPDHQGDSPLHKAFRYRNFDAVELLVKRGANVNVRDKYNSTLLHEASSSASGNLDVIQLLLRLGADVNALDYRGDSPLHKTFQYQNFEAMELLVEDSPLHRSHVVEPLIIDLVPPLSKKCTGVMNAWETGRSTPLHDAPQGEKGCDGTALTPNGANVNAPRWLYKLRYIWHYLRDPRPTVEHSLVHGADVVAQDDED